MNDISATDSPQPMTEPQAGRWQGALARGFERLVRRLKGFRREFDIIAIIALFALLCMIPLMYHTIPSGHVAVLWKRFDGGTVTGKSYPEGSMLTLPWDRVYIYDIRLQKIEREIQVLSADGLLIELTLVWRFHLLPQSISNLHKFIGPDYSEALVTPTVGARARDVIALYQPDEIYTDNRLLIQRQILESVRHELVASFNPPGEEIEWLVMDDVLIKSMTLPDGVQAAIVRKNAMFHEMNEYSFRIEREQKEAVRKRIEAVGIRDYQEIVNEGLSESYLRMRGIEATLELAKSPNAKVVVLGNAKNGLPLIFNPDTKDTTSPVPAVSETHLNRAGAPAGIGTTKRAPNAALKDKISVNDPTRASGQKHE